MKMAVFWVVKPCRLVEVYHHCRDPAASTISNHQLLIALMMKAAHTPDMLVNFCQTTHCYNAQDSHLHVSEDVQTALKLQTCFFFEAYVTGI
jgi:hypothetical protein